ncbi:hypothetical protein [Curvivirga aplysinae]|uniref:hypothetical protein n=1 Tax=Curvivirga aplysinae TaxID=2529852 RepID=UPI0012BD7698|nr:hypothetical protein [Curvivirga aplysinae]MTI10261.1 hypothetical protein [Curvivirga aplysinae]
MDSILNLLTEPNTASSILWDPYFSITYLWIGFSAAAFLLLYCFFNRIKGSILRFLISLFLLLTLANPIWVEKEKEPQRDIAILLIDDSPSQNINDRIKQVQDTRDYIKKSITAQNAPLEIRELKLSELVNTDNGRSETLVIEALSRAISEIPPEQYAGTVLITDGQIHDTIEEIETLRDQKNFQDKPLHVLLTGSTTEIDRRITLIDVPSYGMVDEEVMINFRVDQVGRSLPQNAWITIRADGQKPRRMNVVIGQTTSIPIPLERRGPLNVALQVEEIPNEISFGNNQTAFSINAVRDRLKVLLVSGVPHPGERTWRNLLKSDPSVDLVHFTILRPPEKQDDTPVHELSLIAFPTRELFQTKLHEFDLVVFDRYRRRGVLPSIYLRNIVSYVEEGGALLEIGGPSYASPYSLYRTSLGDILPGEPDGDVHQEAFKPKVTEEGIRHPVTARLPMGPVIAMNDDIRWGRWLRQISVEAKEGNVLMHGVADQPLLILNRVEKGRVAQLFSDQIWLWAKGYEGGGPYSELIRRLSHWLMKEPELEENDLKAYIEGDRIFVEMRSLVPQEPIVSIEGPDENITELPLRDIGNGRYIGEKKLDFIGLHQVSNGERTVLATENVGQNKEWQALNATTAHIEPLIKDMYGSYRFIEMGLPDIRHKKPSRQYTGKNWISFVKNNSYKITGVTYRNLINGWVGLILAVLFIMLCWRREAR